MILGPEPLPSGTTIGNYRLDRVLAEGERTTVYGAAHLVLPRRAALKLSRVPAVEPPSAAQRLAREACTLEAFAHPGVARVFECGVHADGRAWVALELVHGEPLSAVFARVGAMPAAAVLALTPEILDVVAAAHRAGLVHRGLSARHVMIAGAGAHRVRVLGWGRAHQPGHRVDLLGERRADIRAVGTIAYQAATGRATSPTQALPPALTHRPVRVLCPELGPEFAGLIEAMLANDPMRRPVAAAVANQLVRWDLDDYVERVRVRATAAARAKAPAAGDGGRESERASGEVARSIASRGPMGW